MGRVVRTSPDALQDIYQQLRHLRTEVTRLRARGVTFEIKIPTGQTYTLTPGDGENWIDPTDGSLHWRVGGHEYMINGTVL